MPYSIGTVIYGIPLTFAVTTMLDQEGGTPEDAGFQEVYDWGGGIYSGYCGVQLGQFDETVTALRLDPHSICLQAMRVPYDTVAMKFELNAPLEITDVKLLPTQAQILEATELVTQQRSDIIARSPAIGTYIVFSTS